MKAGREQLIIPLTSEAAVRRVRPKAELFEKLKSVDGAGQAYVFASTGAKKILSRFFFPDGARHPRRSGDRFGLRESRRLVHRHGSSSAARLRSVARANSSVGPRSLQLEVNTDNEVFVGGEVIEIGSGILNL